MHFPVYVVLPSFQDPPSRKDVEHVVEQLLAPHQYIERDRPGAEEPDVVQHGWWDWYKIGGRFEDALVPKSPSGLKGFFQSKPVPARPVSELLQGWSTESAPVRIVLPDGSVHGGHTRSDEERRWADEAKRILSPYREHLFVVVDCHK